MKQEYVNTQITCDNCSAVIIELEGSVDPWDYDYSHHPPKDRMDECESCHEECIQEEARQNELENQQDPPGEMEQSLIISDGRDSDLEVFLR